MLMNNAVSMETINKDQVEGSVYFGYAINGLDALQFHLHMLIIRSYALNYLNDRPVAMCLATDQPARA